MANTHKHTAHAPKPANHRRVRPERHSIAALVGMDPGNHGTTRISGLLQTLARIDRLPRDLF